MGDGSGGGGDGRAVRKQQESGETMIGILFEKNKVKYHNILYKNFKQYEI